MFGPFKESVSRSRGEWTKGASRPLPALQAEPSRQGDRSRRVIGPLRRHRRGRRVPLGCSRRGFVRGANGAQSWGRRSGARRRRLRATVLVTHMRWDAATQASTGTTARYRSHLVGHSRTEQVSENLVGRTGFELVTSSVSGKSGAVPGVCHRRTESDGESPACENILATSRWV
jgi:hypothetical protein